MLKLTKFKVKTTDRTILGGPTGWTRLLIKTKMMVLSMLVVMHGVALMAWTNWRQKGKMVARKRAVMKIWGETEQACETKTKIKGKSLVKKEEFKLQERDQL